MALTYKDLVATTLKKVEKKLYDNIFKAYPLVEKLISKGQTKEFDGGEKVFIPLEYAVNTTVAWIGKHGTISTDPQEIITASEDDWRFLVGTVVINDPESVMNRGESQIVDLVKSKLRNLEKSMRKQLSSNLHTAQTGNAMNGLPDILSTTTTLHGIAVADFADWIAGYVSDSAVPLTVAAMNIAYNTVSDGADHVDLIDSSQVLYQKYESLLQPQMRFADTRTADAGFENLKFHNAVIVLDKDAASDRQYYLTTDYLWMCFLRDRKFHSFPPVQAANQLDEVIKVVCYTNLMTSNRRMQGMLDGRTV
jgi:hypothetical protein